MRKFLFPLLLLLSFSIAAQANNTYTVLFPFFTDVAPIYDELVNDENAFIAKGKSSMGDMASTMEFLNDVMPDDVVTEVLGKTATVYSSAYKNGNTVDTNIDKVYAIYLVMRGGVVTVYYTECKAVDQRIYQEEIVNGKL